MKKSIKIIVLCLLFMSMMITTYAQKQTGEDTGEIPVYGTVAFVHEDANPTEREEVDTGDKNHVPLLLTFLIMSGSILLMYVKKAVNKQ